MTTKRDPATCPIRADHGAACRPHGVPLADCDGCPHVLPPSQKRTRLVNLLVSEEELARFRAAARRRGVTVSTLIRMLVFDADRQP